MNTRIPAPACSELLAGFRQGAVIGVAALVLVLPPSVGPTLRSDGSASKPASHQVAPPAKTPVHEWRTADFAGHSPSPDAKFVADWVADSRDNAQLPFVVLDKRDARVFVFDSHARLIDSSPVLLGAAAGDVSVAGIGSRPMSEVRPEERTTPAGRFISTPGRNAAGEDVVWVDYNAAVSMHRVRVVDARERRLERLASPDATQRRISYGCINVPVAFYDSVIHTVLGSAKGVVYVLPEDKPVREVFGRAHPRLAHMVEAAPAGDEERASLSRM